MVNWKVVVGSGAVAVVLSLLTGIISGVSFGTLFARAVLWGALFCGAGAAVSYLISRYLPELQSISQKPEAPTPEAPPNVDIVLPGENPHGDFEGKQESSEYFAEPDDSEKPEQSESAEEGPSDEGRGGSMVEEVEEAPDDGGGSQESFILNVASAADLPDLEDEGEADPASKKRGFETQGLSDITSISGRGSRVNVMGHEAETEEIARAIRTALKKDQKG